MRAIAITLCAVGTLSLACGASYAAEPCRRGDGCPGEIPVRPGLVMPVYALWPLHRTKPEITRLVIVIHGSTRKAGRYFRRMARAAREVGKEDASQVIVPHFRVRGDDGTDSDRVAFWDRNADWKRGDGSARFPAGSLGSFEALDLVRRWLARKQFYPNLARVVIAGHSAGGQFVQRYALGSPAAPEGAAIPVRYVVMNPSSYMYFDTHRPDGKEGFAPARGSMRCLVNAYKYGPEGRNDYMSAEPLAAMVQRYRRRDVVYLLGEADNDPSARNLDGRCPAAAQGPHRLARGKWFKAYMDRFFAPHGHRLVLVPGVAHSSNRMFRSPQGKAMVFGD